MVKGPSPQEITKAEKQTRRRLKGALLEPYDMARVVAGIGGISVVVQKRKWQKVREQLNLPQTSSSGNTLYRVWKLYFPKWDGLVVSNDASSSEEEEEEDDSEDSSSMGDTSSSESSEDDSLDDEDDDDDDDDDDSSDSDDESATSSSSSSSSSSTSTKNGNANEENIDQHGSECHICNQPGELLMCDHCTRVFHTTCLTPPLQSPPEGDWKCPVCVETKSREKNKRKRKPLPRVDQSTFSSSVSPKIINTVIRLREIFQKDQTLQSWEFDLTRLMLHDRSPAIKSSRILVLVQAALDDYELSQMGLDLSHTLSRVFLMVYEVGWHQPKRKRNLKRGATKKARF